MPFEHRFALQVSEDDVDRPLLRDFKKFFKRLIIRVVERTVIAGPARGRCLGQIGNSFPDSNTRVGKSICQTFSSAVAKGY